MKILITGGAGFLGSHLCEAFLIQGHEIVCVDDLSTGSIDNIRELMKLREFRFINHDVREPINLEADIILNFACPASPRQYQSDPVRTIETNFLGIINLLHLAKKNKSRLIQASTSEVYGDPQFSPQPENYWGNVNPIGIRSCYDEGKRAAETLCFDYRRQYGVDTRVVRIFNTYGPRMAVGDGRVVSNFIVQALRGNDITIYGEGNQTRSFCYVDDLIEAIMRMSILKNNPDTPINIGNDGEFTMNELAKIVIEITGSRSNIIHTPLPSDDPKQRKPDLTLAKKILNWSPRIQLREGIENTISYFRNIDLR